MIGTLTVLLYVGLAVALLLGLRRKKAPPDCKTCAYHKDGGCRRFPPQRVYTGDRTQDPYAYDVTLFPVVMNADGWWCGEYKEKR